MAEPERPGRPAGRDMVRWGWGAAGHPRELPPGALAFLGEELGPLPPASRPPGPAACAEASRLTTAGRDALQAVCEVDESEEARLLHATGRSYPDLVRQRAGGALAAPDAVVSPGDGTEVERVLGVCAEHGIAVVPWGGGTSVVGGVEPLAGGFPAVIALDLGRMDRLLSLDERSLTAVFEPGVRGPEAEDLLAARGYSLGHFPQSFEYATLGGFAATRSAGQASTGYGRFDELVLGLRAVAPGGVVDLPPRPASAAGPELRELMIGSEGTLGVITEIALQVRPRPASRHYEGWSFARWEDGAEALRALEQAGLAPDVARLSDPAETRLGFAQAGGGAGIRALHAYLRARRQAAPCLSITGWEGDRDSIARRREQAAPVLRRHGAVTLGSAPGTAWEHGRYRAPYLRDSLMAHGVMVETLETATQWSGLQDLYRAVGDALRAALAARGTPPLVLCHVSHLYPSGASLYFTFLARQEAGAELDQWRAAKQAATQAIIGAGGTITHHHAVGTDHAAWMTAEVGEVGVRLLAAAKRELDPDGLMNPGKLLP